MRTPSTHLEVAKNLIELIKYRDEIVKQLPDEYTIRLFKSAIKESFNKSLRQKTHLHKRLVLDEFGDEHDHAIPLEFIFQAAEKYLDEKRLTKILKRCLISIRVSRLNHQRLHATHSPKLPGRQDLLRCDLLGRYRKCFGENVEKQLKHQLDNRKNVITYIIEPLPTRKSQILLETV